MLRHCLDDAGCRDHDKIVPHPEQKGESGCILGYMSNPTIFDCIRQGFAVLGPKEKRKRLHAHTIFLDEEKANGFAAQYNEGHDEKVRVFPVSVLVIGGFITPFNGKIYLPGKTSGDLRAQARELAMKRLGPRERWGLKVAPCAKGEVSS